MAEPTIRVATPDDAEALTHLHLDVWDDAYTGMIPQSVLDGRRADVDGQIEKRRAWLSRPRNPILLAYDGDLLVGFANAGPARDADAPTALELRAIYVRASHWGTGLGHRLLVEAIGDQSAYLWVFSANARAIEFYRRHGFVPDGTTKDSVEGPEERLVRR